MGAFGIALFELDIQPFLCIETLFNGGIVAGKLKLMKPTQLDGDLFQLCGMSHTRSQTQ